MLTGIDRTASGSSSVRSPGPLGMHPACAPANQNNRWRSNPAPTGLCAGVRPGQLRSDSGLRSLLQQLHTDRARVQNRLFSPAERPWDEEDGR